jgi:hypothetical protein
MMPLFQIVTVLAAMQTTPAPAEPPTGTIRVMVTVAGTQTPIAGAQVTLGPPGPSGHLSNLPTNEADLLAYLSQLALARGAQPISLVLSPAAAISGHVTDWNGMAAPNAAVSLAISEVRNGVPTLIQGRTVRTDARGNYRLSPVGPGDYYIRVQLAPFDSASFYPAASNATKAVMVPVRGGEDIVGVDLKMPSTFRITGTVPDSAGSVRGFYLVDPRGINPIRNIPPTLDGKFEVEDIPAGTWDIFATFGGDSMQTGRARVHVVNQDVSEVIVEDISSDLRGRFVTTATARIFENLKVSLIPFQNLPAPVSTHVQAPVSVSSDGTFLLRGITPGPYRLVMQPLPGGYSISEIRVGGRRLEGNIFIVTEGFSESIEVVLRDP